MNKHLLPVFNYLLPELEKANIDYWVYGGVSIAAYAGKFVRFNEDVDFFVKNNDFERTKSVLEKICHQKEFILLYRPPSKGNHRPKLDIKISDKKVATVIPVYLKDRVVEFEYPEGNEVYSKLILEKAKKIISSYTFFTPKDRFIKEIFINHITTRPDKKKREKYQIDARAILSPEELVKLNWHIDKASYTVG